MAKDMLKVIRTARKKLAEEYKDLSLHDYIKKVSGIEKKSKQKNKSK